MAIMIPQLDPLKIDNTGERVLYRELRDQLPNTWTVRYHYPMCAYENGRLRESEADFIVLAPSKGLMLLEVKGSVGWECKDGQWYRIEMSGARVLADNPFFQASGAKHTVVEKIARKLGFSEGKNAFPGIFGHAVVYPLATLIGGLPASQEPQIIVTRRNMNDLKKWLEDAFDSWTGNNTSRAKLFTPQVMERVVKILRDDCRFVLNEGSAIDSDEATISELTQKQFEFFQGVLQNHRLMVEGVAGSGKTLLAQLAADMLSRRVKRVLLLCYNKNLAGWLESSGNGTRKYDIRSFHSLCSQLCRQAQIPFAVPESAQASDKFWRELAPNLVSSAIDILGKQCRYDAILVDEAQDFRQDWWIPVELLLNGPAAHLCVFLDRDQSLYGQPEPLPAGLNSFVLRLDENCRNTRRIVDFGSRVIAKNIQPHDLSPVGVAPTLLEPIPDAAPRAEIIRQLVVDLLNQGLLPSQVAILSPWQSIDNPNAALHHLRQVHGKPIVGQDSADIARWKSDQAVWGSTIKSFKGMEAACVILTDIPALDASNAFTVHDLYVALSRAKHRLFVLPSNRTAFEQLKQLLPV